MIAFGPVPSRRLGRSLGINNIPPKACTYACRYCQVGPTPGPETEPRAFYEPETVAAAVGQRLAALGDSGEGADYLTFVPDGEPTLDANLGRVVGLLRTHALPIAVVTNGSLLWRPDVRRRLANADWVSVKVDAARESAWRRVNRPHPGLDFDAVLEGQLRFADGYGRRLVTETMLLDGVNDGESAVRRTAAHVGRLAPEVAYVAVPTRPGADPRVRPATEDAVARAYEIFRNHVEHVELLTHYEGVEVGATGDIEQDLLATASVHPLRQDQVESLLARCGRDWSVVEALLARGDLEELAHGEHTFYRTVRS